MSDRRNNQHQQGSFLKSAACFLGGAVAGAAIAGMAYLSATEEDRNMQQHRQLQQQRPPATDCHQDEEVEEKVNGVVKVCEICFVDFETLKGHEVHIMATPCGHVFCRICIQEALTRKPECPHCRQHVEINQLQRLFL